MHQNIHAEKAYFIKLGGKGCWEKDCIDQGTIRLGYNNVSHEACLSGAWDQAKNVFKGYDKGAATRHINQIYSFYEEPETTLWVTFFSNRLWWCFSRQNIVKLDDGSKIRNVIGMWNDKDTKGNTLIKARLSGKLLSVQSYQGTICSIKEKEYLLHKINGTSEPHVEDAINSLLSLEESITPIIKNLHPKDLETLTDLIFRQSGWQRTGVAGEVEKDIDLDLISPVTQERIAVQVKSKATLKTYMTYQDKFSNMSGYSKFYFVTHSPNHKLQNIVDEDGNNEIIFWDVKQLAKQSVRNGLVVWLIDKAS